MSWTPLTMYQPDMILYGYADNRRLSGLIVFKITEKEGNKLTLRRLKINPSKLQSCSLPSNEFMNKENYYATVNERSGEAIFKDGRLKISLERWKGKPIYHA